MTVEYVAKYICDTCGKEYLDIDECENCENSHYFAEEKDNLRFWDYDGNKIPVEFSANWASIYYVKWLTPDAKEAFLQWWEDKSGVELSFYDDSSEDCALYYYDEATEKWFNFLDLSNKFNFIKKLYEEE